MSLEFVETQSLANRYVELLQKSEQVVYIVENLNVLMENMTKELELVENELIKRKVQIKEISEHVSKEE